MIASVFFFALLGALLALLFPERLVRIANTVSRRTFLSFLLGLLAFPALPVLVVVLCITVVGIPVAAFGLLNPVLAGAAMALSSVSVVSNALLLRGWRPQPRPGAAQPDAQAQTVTLLIDNPQGEAKMYELTVEDMSCGHCVGRVTKAVQQVDQDAKVAIDLPTKKVKIDSQADLDRIAAAIDEAGYPVSARAAS